MYNNIGMLIHLWNHPKTQGPWKWRVGTGKLHFTSDKSNWVSFYFIVTIGYPPPGHRAVRPRNDQKSMATISHCLRRMLNADILIEKVEPILFPWWIFGYKWQMIFLHYHFVCHIQKFKNSWPSTLLSDKEIHPTFPLWIPILQLQNATGKTRSFPKRAVLPQKLRLIGAAVFSG